MNESEPRVLLKIELFFKKHNYFMIILATFFVAIAQFLLKKGAVDLQLSVQGILFNAPLIIGLGIYFINATMFILILRNADLSTAYPIMSLSFVWVLFFSAWFLGEELRIAAIMGVILIVFGTWFMGREASR